MTYVKNSKSFYLRLNHLLCHDTKKEVIVRTFFGSIFKKVRPSPKKLPDNVKKALEKNHSCYILITCGKPTKEGNMQVEMSYEGDAYLAAYLIESAQGFIDDDIPV